MTDLKARLISLEDIIQKRDELQDELSKTYKGSPKTFSKAYVTAQKSLQINEELTFSNEEIDKFLPTPLGKK